MQRSRILPMFGARGFRLAAGLLCGICVVGSAEGRDAEASQLRSAVVAAKAGKASPAAADFDVRLGGEPAEVIAVDALAPAPDGRPWQVLVYFDTPLLTPGGLEEAIRILSASADELSALGPVSIVVADPEARDLLVKATRPHEIRESLNLFLDKTTLAGELLWRRLRFLEAVRESEIDEPRAVAEMEREQGVIDRQRAALLSSLVQRADGDAGLLILVQDGFDLDFKRFYLSRTAEFDGLETDVDEAHTSLCRAIAAAGWTVLALAPGEQGSEFVSPRQPLRQLVDATGGELVLDDRALRRSLLDLGGRVRLTYRASAADDDLLGLEVRYRDRAIRGPRWASGSPSGSAADPTLTLLADSRAVVRLLSPGPGPHTGPTRITAVTGEHEVGHVAFFLDGFLVDVARAEPFQARLDLGDGRSPRTLRAEAFSPGALKLGEDTLQLNEEDRPFQVDIVEVRGDPRDGEVELRASVSTPIGRKLDRIDFYWNQELRQSFEAPMAASGLAATLPTAPPRPTDHYRVVARLDDGSSLEAARMAIESGTSDRLDVNLVELYALVTDRRKAPLEVLTREDFSVFHGGRSRSIQGFARAQDVPLTLGLAVDTSDSMAEWQDDLRDGAAVFFESALGSNDRALMIDFDSRARLTQGPTQQQELLVGRLGALDFGGFTSLYDAILFSLAQFEGEGGRKALVVLTDGDDYDSRFRPERCIDEALRLGVPIYMVVLEPPGAFIDDVERLINHRLAEQTGGRAFFFSSREKLAEIYEAIEEDLRSQYLLTYALERPLTAADLGDIRVEVRDRKMSVRTVLGSSVRVQ